MEEVTQEQIHKAVTALCETMIVTLTDTNRKFWKVDLEDETDYNVLCWSLCAQVLGGLEQYNVEYQDEPLSITFSNVGDETS